MRYSHKFCQSIHIKRNCRLHKTVTLQNESNYSYPTINRVSGSVSSNVEMTFFFISIHIDILITYIDIIDIILI